MSDKVLKFVGMAPGDLPLRYKDVVGDGTEFAPVVALEPGSIGGGVGGGGGPADVALGSAASELDITRQKMTAAVRLLDTSQIAGSQLVAARGDMSAGMWVNIKNASLAVTGTFWQATQPVSGTFFQATQPVSIAASVNVGNFPATQPVSLATNTPDVTDRAARLLGHVTVDNASLAVTGTFFQATQPVSGTFFQATQPVSAATLPLPTGAATSANQSTVKAASTIAAATDTASVVQQSPQRADASNLAVTATAATGVAATLTIPAAAAGLFHYINLIEMELYATAARTGGATPVVVTSTNLPGSPAWDFDTAQAIGVTIRKVLDPATPIKSSVAATATTIVAPIATTGIWRITAYYYTAP